MTHVKNGTMAKSVEIKSIELQKTTSIEELQSKIEELNKIIESKKMPEKLDDLMKFYRERNQKIQKLEVFNAKSKEIRFLLKRLDDLKKENDFETVQDFSFSLFAPNENGRNTELIKISNPDIFLKVTQYIDSVISERIVLLEAEIKA